MPLSPNEIKSRATQFSKKWQDESRERAEKDSFWNDFFEIFGIDRKRVAVFEMAVKKLGGKQGFIDLFWKGTLLVEQKSQGKSLDKAFEQALDYFPGLKEYELPKYVLVCDFQRFRLYDLEEKITHEFELSELVNYTHLFGFISGYKKQVHRDEDPVNVKAAELMGDLHDRLREVGYEGHYLEVYLVRLLFCMFAEDSNVFERGIFREYIELHTNEDGSDLAMHLAQLFQVLNTPENQRLANLDENLNQFRYINGQLFEEQLPFASFDSKMRDMLLDASALDWSKISPAIFGSMFQAAMNPKERRNLGAHYTSERNILKLIQPLFLDELYTEFGKAKVSLPKLTAFQKKIAHLKFLDPACGSGNFLIITYRELRELEILVIKELFKKRKKTGQQSFSIELLINVDVDQFYGIEYDEFAAKIAEVALWLIDHQMNMRVSEEFGEYFTRLPLKKSPTIVHGNSLQMDWGTLLGREVVEITADQTNVIQVMEPQAHYQTLNVYTKNVSIFRNKWQNKDLSYINDDNGFDYIIGNPPFYGSKLQSTEQRDDLKNVFGTEVKNAKIMDYVSAWYIKAAQLIQNTRIKAAFVSTNSIVQGEQVGVLWNEMLNKYGIKIHFAHRTFKWKNDAKSNAAVYCVIIGFANFDTKKKYIFDYEDIKGEPNPTKAQNINPYLVDAPDIVITKRTQPIANVPKMSFGNMPLDGGNLLLSDEDKIELLEKEPNLAPYIKPLISAREFLNGQKRWCIWLVDASPKDLKSSPELMRRIKAVKEFRLASVAPSTQKHAATPSLFRDKNNPETFIVVPRVSSENRKYIPMGFFDKNSIVSDTCMSIPNGDIYLFGMLTSLMHMTWVKYTCGRLKSDFRYSKNIVYNNYPFPKEPIKKNQQKVEKVAHKILEIREKYPESSLADLYDPLTTPPDLVKAHQQLNKAVDLCYRPQAFTNERKRIEYLFELHESYNAPLLKLEKRKKRR